MRKGIMRSIPFPGANTISWAGSAGLYSYRDSLFLSGKAVALFSDTLDAAGHYRLGGPAAQP